jgi:hypothetical protein
MHLYDLFFVRSIHLKSVVNENRIQICFSTFDIKAYFFIMKHFKALMIVSLPAAFGLQAKDESFGSGLKKGFFLGGEKTAKKNTRTAAQNVGSASTSQTVDPNGTSQARLPPKEETSNFPYEALQFPAQTSQLPLGVPKTPRNQGWLFAKDFERLGQLTPERIRQIQHATLDEHFMELIAANGIGRCAIMNDQQLQDDLPEFLKGVGEYVQSKHPAPKDGSARTSQTEQLPAAGLRGSPQEEEETFQSPVGPCPYPRETSELPEHVRSTPFEQGRYFAENVLASQGELTHERIAALQQMTANTNFIRMCATMTGSDHLNERMSDQRMKQDFPEFFRGINAYLQEAQVSLR